MITKSKPKLRMAPSMEALTEQQQAAARLLALDKWTEEPNNPPATGPAANIVPVVITEPAAPVPPVVIEQPAPARVIAPKQPASKPWEGGAAAAPHPYHTVMSEGLFQKIDFVWKRKGYKSMKEWVIETLEHEANKSLKGLGEL